MTRPARPYARDPFHPEIVDPCCDDNAPQPRWVGYALSLMLDRVTHGQSYQSPQALEPQARAMCVARLENPDRLWCSKCSTALEDFREEWADALPLVLQLVATIASFVPGIGTVVADIAGTCAALAAGESLSDALVDGAMAAIPGGPVWAGCARAGRDILDGQRVDRALVDGARAAIAYEGGPLAAAAFDAVLAMAQGKCIQEAGFAGLKALASGNSLAERAANYAETVLVAAEQGRSVADVLVAELVSDCVRAAGAEASTLIAPVVARLKESIDLGDLSMLEWGSQAFADAMRVAEPIARAAQAIMRTGKEDLALSGSVRAASFALLTVSRSAQGQENIARAVYAMSTPAQRAEVLRLAAAERLRAAPVHALPGLMAAGARVSSAIAAVRPPPATPMIPVAVVTSSRVIPVRQVASYAPSSPASDVVIGASVGVLGLALWFCFKD